MPGNFKFQKLVAKSLAILSSWSIAGTTVTATAAEINKLAGNGATAADLTKLHALTPTAAQLNDYHVALDIADASAEAVYYLVCPQAGTISKIQTVTDSAVLTADVTVTPAIGATGITNGVVTMPVAGAAAGNIATATPSAANVITAGAAVNFTVTGGGAAGTGPRIHLVMTITR